MAKAPKAELEPEVEDGMEVNAEAGPSKKRTRGKKVIKDEVLSDVKIEVSKRNTPYITGRIKLIVQSPYFQKTDIESPKKRSRAKDEVKEELKSPVKKVSSVRV